MSLLRKLAAVFALAAPFLAQSAPPPIQLREVASGLTKPVQVVSPRDGTGRLFIVEKDGLIRILQNGVVKASPFLDLRTRVATSGERGLQSLAFDPQWSQFRRVFVAYTQMPDDTTSSGAGAMKVTAYHASSFDTNIVSSVDLDYPVITIAHPGSGANNGGRLAFGPDGNLYIAMGDGGVDPVQAQLNSHFGKILRITPAAQFTPGYTTPPNDIGYLPETWARGVRNPSSLAFDRATGDLYITDQGPAIQEANRIAAGAAPGENLGWPYEEGDTCVMTSYCPNPLLRRPGASYANDAIGGSAIVGGVVYRGAAMPGLVGYYVYGDRASNRIWASRFVGQFSTWETHLLIDTGGILQGLSSIAEDDNGELYASDRVAGKVFAIEASSDAPAIITNPAAGATLLADTAVFTWSASPATLYQLWVGSTPGTHDIGFYPPAGTTANSVQVTGLPTDGRTLYVRLYSLIDGAYQYTERVYTAWTAPAANPAALLSPAPGSTLTGATQTFQWTAAANATNYQLWVGSTAGANDIGFFPPAGTSGTSITAAGLPMDGRTLYVRLYSFILGTWLYRDYTFTARASAIPAITSPAPGSTLTDIAQTFTWSDVGATSYQLWVGNSVGAFDIGYFPAGGTTATATTAFGLPGDGRTLYVRINALVNGVWTARDYTYTAIDGGPAALLVFPTDGATLTGTSQFFAWSPRGGTYFQLWVGSSPGAFDIGYFPGGGTSADSTTVTGLPNDGRMLHVRLYSLVNGAYQFRDYTFHAVSKPAAVLNSPANGSTLPSATVTFQWDSVGASLYQLWIGNTPGAYDVGYFPAAGTTGTSVSVSGLPTDGRTLYARLFSAIDGVWKFTDATFTAAAPRLSTVASPVPTSVLQSPNVEFIWSPGVGVTARTLAVGTSRGASDVYSGNEGTGLSRTVANIPMNGNVYVRLGSLIGGTWHYSEHVYSTYMNAALGTIAMPGDAASAVVTTGDGLTFHGGSLIDGIERARQALISYASYTVTITPLEPRLIDRVVVYSVPDSWPDGAEPTDAATFTLYGARDFTVEVFDGTAWAAVAIVAGNDLLKRAVTFAPRLATALRVTVPSRPGGPVVIAEIEAWQPQPAGCAALPGSADHFAFGTLGAQSRLKTFQDDIAVALLPVTGYSRMLEMMTFPSPFTFSPPNGTVDLAFSKCPGDIPPAQGFCSLSFGSGVFSSPWVETLSATYPSKQAIELSGICPALASEGPWYLNVRFHKPEGCASGAAECGYVLQWQ